MKKVLVLAMAVMLSIISCDKDDELLVFDNENGQTALSFTNTSYNLSIPEEDLSLEIPVNVTTVSNQDRTFDVSVESATNPSEFSVGSVVIPAGEYSGVLTVNFDFSAITGADGETKTVVFNLTPPAGGGAAYRDVATVVYFREIVCNDPVLTLNTDFFAPETGYFITNSSTNEIEFEIPQFSLPYGVATYTFNIPTLADGTYTSTITDYYADGQVSSTAVGSYSLDCSIINLVTAGGRFGASQTRTFQINP